MYQVPAYCYFLFISADLTFVYMAEFKTPTRIKCRSKVTDNVELGTPIRIPASPFLEQIGYGTGIAVYMLERSPKVGCIRSPWAIKKWLKGENNEANDGRLRLEADFLRQLKHPNIVGFRAFTAGADGKPCLAMEALDISIGDIIEQKRENADEKPFPAKDILTVGYEVAKGLKYLHHTAHVLHGDIKSPNILVAHDFSVVKLCDFGHSLPLTESLELDTSKGDFFYCGTESWNAPEVHELEDGPVTNAADIWAYGLVIWEMIALLPPHIEIEDIQNDESSDESVIDADTTNKSLNDSNYDMNESVIFLKEIITPRPNKFGPRTRPALPAINLNKKYDKILEVFFICTNADYKLRPSAEVLVNYFEKYTCANKTRT